MTQFNWYKAIGYGLLIWAIMFAVVWGTIAFGIFASVWTQIVLAIVAGVVTYMFALNARASDAGPAIGYGVVFAVLGIALDLLISRQFVPELFGLWTYYLAYAAILFAPLVQLGYGGSTSPRAI